MFYPVGTSGPALLQIAEAKTVCRRCPVVSDCLTWALVMWIFVRTLVSELAFSVMDMSMALAEPGSIPSPRTT